MTTRPNYFLYDGRCGLCRAFKDWLMDHARPGTFEAVDFDDPRVREILPQKSETELRETAHVVTPDGRVRSGHAAILVALSVSWWGRLLAAVLGWPVFDPILRWGYHKIAQYRYRLSCKIESGREA